jgi:hypothetical protein
MGSFVEAERGDVKERSITSTGHTTMVIGIRHLMVRIDKQRSLKMWRYLGSNLHANVPLMRYTVIPFAQLMRYAAVGKKRNGKDVPAV